MTQREEWFAHCDRCDQPMERVKIGRRPWMFHCSRCDPPVPSLEERADRARALPPLDVLCSGKPVQLDDGRVGQFLARLYEPDVVLVLVEGKQERWPRHRVTRAAS